VAAGRSRVQSIHRGATTGQGVRVLREGMTPLPSIDVSVSAINSPEEISGWLGTFGERLRMARAQVAVAVQPLT